jgi:hypothetical protein
VSTAGHRKVSASLWSFYMAAVSIFAFGDTLRSPRPDVTPLQIFAFVTLIGLAAITGFCFALGQHWAHATMRVLTIVFVTVFIIFVGPEFATFFRGVLINNSLAGLPGIIIMIVAFLIGLYACIVSWRTPLPTKEV